MSPTTRRQTREQTQQLQNDPSSADRVDEFATMYPAFVTAPVPVEILDELIDEAKEGIRALGAGDEVGGSLCILDTEDLDSIVHGSRKPMQPFEPPFIGMTDDEIRSWMNEHKHPHFAELTFAVLDEDTARNKTCRIGYIFKDEPDGDKMLITDFYASMYIRVPLEMVTVSWYEEELVGTDKVFGRKTIEEEWRKVSENVAAAESQGKGRV